MALIVRFINDKKTVLVTELIEHRLIRIMAGSNCIKIVLLYQFQILFHLCDRNHRTGHRIAVMAIHAAKLHRPTVNVYNIAFDMNLANSDPLCNNLILRFQNQGIEIRALTVPEHRILQLPFRLVFKCNATYLLILRVQKGRGNRHRTIQITSPDTKDCRLTLELGIDKIVKDSLLRPLQKIDITKDAAHPELILIFQITSITPL